MTAANVNLIMLLLDRPVLTALTFRNLKQVQHRAISLRQDGSCYISSSNNIKLLWTDRTYTIWWRCTLQSYNSSWCRSRHSRYKT